MVSAFLCLGFFLVAPIAAGKKHVADRIYETAMERIESVTVADSIRAFRRVLKADRNYAPAHYEIAKLYLSA